MVIFTQITPIKLNDKFVVKLAIRMVEPGDRCDGWYVDVSVDLCSEIAQSVSIIVKGVGRLG